MEKRSCNSSKTQHNKLLKKNRLKKLEEKMKINLKKRKKIINNK